VARRRWRSEQSARSQHYLAATVAGELVRDAGIAPAHIVLDIGAGTGVLTSLLVRRASRVIAVESDATLARGLRRRFDASPTVEVVEADILDTPLPDEPFVVVSNPPFHITTALLRHLLTPTALLQRADLVMSWGQAVGLIQVYPQSRLALEWLPWYELVLMRRLEPRSFHPPPSCAAAVVSIRKRDPPLLNPADGIRYRDVLRRGRTQPTLDVWDTVRSCRATRRLSSL